ncbi:hypothetical protein ACI2KR_23895 [Pseudomonas luteola]
MNQKLFLTTSKNVARRLTELFDFVWPTAAAIWNLRWQVSGLMAVNPELTHDELQGRFVGGSGIRGANLRKACIDSTWEDQQQEFARFLLFEFCSLYEAWCEGSLAELGQDATLSKDLQFPTSTTNGTERGISRTTAVINGSQSAILTAAIHQPLLSNRKYSLPHLEQLLICYRYFKEVRNSLVHGGGSPSTRFINAEAAYAALSTTDLGVKEIPEYQPYTQGSPIAVSLRGVVGFGDIVLKLVCTLDIEFSKSTAAEGVFISRWKSVHGQSPVVIAQDPHDRETRIRNLVRKLNLPKPATSDAFLAWLSANRLIV